MSSFWILLKQDDGGAGDNGAKRHANLEPNCHHQQNIQFFYRPDVLPVTQQQCQSTEGKMTW